MSEHSKPPSFSFPGTPTRYARDRRVDLRHVLLDLEVDLGAGRLEGSVTHRFRSLRRDLRHLLLDAVEMEILEVRDGEGSLLGHTHDGAGLTIELPDPLGRGEEGEVTVRYRVEDPRRGFYFIEPDEAYPDRPRMAWSQGQDEDSRYWWPSYDYPNEKASTEMKVTVPEGCYALSNGRLVERKTLEDGRERFHWSQEVPHVAYLVTLVAGPFEVIEETAELPGGKEVPLLTIYPPGREKEARRAVEGTAEMVRLFSEKTGVDYPFEKYAQVFVSEFTFGGMENSSATTLTEDALRDARAALDTTSEDLVAHELAHQWFGDLVTCRDWSHAWLNEGFATFFEVVWKEHRRGREEAWWHLRAMRERYGEEARERYQRPIVCRTYDAPIDLFDAHLYLKGAWVLHALRARLGEEDFWACVRRYLQDNRERGLVEVDDLRRAIEQTTGRNLEEFFSQWLASPGIPSLELEARWQPDEEVLVLSARQSQKGEGVPEVFDLETEVALAGPEGWVRRPVRLRRRDQEIRLPLDHTPRAVAFDPDWTALADVRFPRPLAWLRYQLEKGPTAASRADAAGELGRDASAGAVAALRRSLLDEDESWGVRSAAARALGKIPARPACEALVAGLDTEHPKARRAAAKALGKHRRPEAFEALAARFRAGDPSYMVEAETARAAGSTGAPEAVEFLLEALERESWNEVVRAGALEGLAETGDPRGVEAILEWTEYGRPARARTAAAGALGEAGWVEGALRRRVRQRLEELVDDPNFRVRVAAADALGGLGDPDAARALRALVERVEDGRVRRAARESLRVLQESSGAGQRIRRLTESLDETRSRLARLERRLAGLEGTPERD